MKCCRGCRSTGSYEPAFAIVLGLIRRSCLCQWRRAAPPAIAQTEINYLLEFLEQLRLRVLSQRQLVRLETGAGASASKYEWLAARDQINTAEDFIEKAATRSSLSGQPYEVRCGGGASGDD